MEDIFVARVMSTDLQTVSPDTLVEDAASLMLEKDVGSLAVVDDEGHLEGILTTTDFVEIVSRSAPKAETTVSRYATTDVTTATAQQSIREVADRMIAEGFHHMPVVDEEAGLIGMISTTDLAGYVSGIRKPSPAE